MMPAGVAYPQRVISLEHIIDVAVEGKQQRIQQKRYASISHVRNAARSKNKHSSFQRVLPSVGSVNDKGSSSPPSVKIEMQKSKNV